jgi:hypothetical protein
MLALHRKYCTAASTSEGNRFSWPKIEMRPESLSVRQQLWKNKAEIPIFRSLF